jgi:hypothetical protein
MTKAELKEKLNKLADDLGDVQGEIEDIPSTAIEDIDITINGGTTKTYHHVEGIDSEIQNILEALNDLSEADIEDDDPKTDEKKGGE